MKKAILKKLMILFFAFGALFLIGNNVFAGPDNKERDSIAPAITCSQFSGDGARCWLFDPYQGGCIWTGYQINVCIIL